MRDIALAAGSILLEHYSGTPSVEWKGVGDPVTAADRAASAFIVTELHKRFPGDGILSEEEGDTPERLALSRVWIIDPMDGTKEFIARVGEFSVMIGLAVNGAPAAGAVYQPTAGKLYLAARGRGAHLEQGGASRPLQVDREADPRRARMAMSRSHRSKTVEQIANRLGIVDTISLGSIGLKAGLIAEGGAHCYVHPNDRTSQWDTCAPDILLREAGGLMTDLAGVPMVYNLPERRNLNGVIASNGALHERVVAAVRG